MTAGIPTVTARPPAFLVVAGQGRRLFGNAGNTALTLAACGAFPAE